MDTTSRRIAVIVAVCTLAIATISIVIGFVGLIFVLHDGQQTSDLVNKLMDLATAGLAAMAFLLGVNHSQLAKISDSTAKPTIAEGQGVPPTDTAG